MRNPIRLTRVSCLPIRAILIVVPVWFLLAAMPASATPPFQAPTPATAEPTRTPPPKELLKTGAEAPSGAPVMVNNQILFRLQSRVGSISPTERASKE